ncbi:MAG TPA: hypothetical protein VK176_12225 [Phycisphaerales bacterium]|nr:hypothetical protein [Phycisphaerales bacterium]
MSTPPAKRLTHEELVSLGMAHSDLVRITQDLKQCVERLYWNSFNRDLEPDRHILKPIADQLEHLGNQVTHHVKLLRDAWIFPPSPPMRAREADGPPPRSLNPIGPTGGELQCPAQSSAGGAAPSQVAPPPEAEFSGPGGPHKEGDRS